MNKTSFLRLLWITPAILIAISLSGFSAIQFTQQNLTLEEALEKLQQLNVEDDLHHFTFVLPEYYKNKEHKQDYDLSRKNLEALINSLDLHSYGLEFEIKNKNHLVFYRSHITSPRSDKLSLQEALAAVDRKIRTEKLHTTTLEPKQEWQITYAESKFNRISKEKRSRHHYGGQWWHIVYEPRYGTDGGTQVVHFIVYKDLLTEVILDGMGRGRGQWSNYKTISELRKVTPPPSF